MQYKFVHGKISKVYFVDLRSRAIQRYGMLWTGATKTGTLDLIEDTEKNEIKSGMMKIKTMAKRLWW